MRRPAPCENLGEDHNSSVPFLAEVQFHYIVGFKIVIDRPNEYTLMRPSVCTEWTRMWISMEAHHPVLEVPQLFFFLGSVTLSHLCLLLILTHQGRYYIIQLDASVHNSLPKICQTNNVEQCGSCVLLTQWEGQFPYMSYAGIPPSCGWPRAVATATIHGERPPLIFSV